MKKSMLIVLMLFIGGFVTESIAAVNTEAFPPKYRPHKKRTSKFRAKIFKVRVSRFNNKIRTRHDNLKKKELGKKKGENYIGAHRMPKKRYKALY